MTPLLANLAETLADLFDELNIPYAFGGALANNVWGIIRATQDADCLVSVPAIQFQQLADGLNEIGCTMRSNRQAEPVTVDELRRQIESRKLMEVFWNELRADLFVPIVPLQSEILRRAVLVRMDRREIKVTTAEDLILLKMVFRRPKDFDDIRGMLHSQRGKLNLDYLESWAAKSLDEQARAQLESLVAEYAQDDSVDKTDRRRDTTEEYE